MRSRRWLTIALGAPLLAFGLASLHYTKPDALDHHRQQAERYGFPAPSNGILYLGAAATAFGAGLVGFGLRRDSARS
jgi:hypothetical protein